MTAREVAAIIESWMPLSIQEAWDNSGFCVGLPQTQVRGVLLCLDVTSSVLEEAMAVGANLIVSHHPLIFHGVKQLCGQNEVARIVATAIKQDLVIYSAHTNADKVATGVSGVIAQMLGLQDLETLSPEAPATSSEVSATSLQVGLGMVGNLPAPLEVHLFLSEVKRLFNLPCLRVSSFSIPFIRRVALCGGSGSSLISKALDASADIFLSGDISYHHFFSTEGKMMIADIGHYESEIGIIHKLEQLLSEKNLTFAVSIAKNNTNPIYYF